VTKNVPFSATDAHLQGDVFLLVRRYLFKVVSATSSEGFLVVG